jgi:hypothetical protein
MLLTKQGMYFMTIEMITGPPTKFNFDLNKAEYGYKDTCVKGAFEFEAGKFIVLANGSDRFLLTKRIGKNSQL